MSTKTRKTLDILGSRIRLSAHGSTLTATLTHELSRATGRTVSDKYPVNACYTNRSTVNDALITEAKRRGCRLVDVYASSPTDHWQVDQLDIEPDAAEDIDEDLGT